MIEKICSIILNFVISLVNIILLPIDSLIEDNIPALSDILSTVNSFLNWIINNISYAVDGTLLPHWLIVVIFSYLIFKINVKWLCYAIKLAIKWYNALKT